MGWVDGFRCRKGRKERSSGSSLSIGADHQLIIIMYGTLPSALVRARLVPEAARKRERGRERAAKQELGKAREETKRLSPMRANRDQRETKRPPDIE